MTLQRHYTVISLWWTLNDFVLGSNCLKLHFLNGKATKQSMRASDAQNKSETRQGTALWSCFGMKIMSVYVYTYIHIHMYKPSSSIYFLCDLILKTSKNCAVCSLSGWHGKPGAWALTCSTQTIGEWLSHWVNRSPAFPRLALDQRDGGQPRRGKHKNHAQLRSCRKHDVQRSSVAKRQFHYLSDTQWNCHWGKDVI